MLLLSSHWVVTLFYVVLHWRRQITIGGVINLGKIPPMGSFPKSVLP